MTPGIVGLILTATMPFIYTIDVERNLIRLTFRGPVVAKDLEEVGSAIWADPRYRTQMDVLADMRQAKVDMTYDQMSDYARFMSSRSSMHRHAVVVSRRLEFGLARMYEQLTDAALARAELRVFFDMEAAEHWLREVQPAEQSSSSQTG